MRVDFLDCSFDVLTMEQTVSNIGSALAAGRFTQHGVVNVAKLISMREDAELKSAVESCDIVNVDGMGVVWGAKFLGVAVPERVTGIDLFRELLVLSQERGHGVFLLGGTQDVVDVAAAKLQREFPELKIAGKHHGYFWDNEAGMVEEVSRSGAELLFVAISSPLKEKFIARWREQLGVKFVMGVGGTFDVVAGKVRRAPIWMQRFGLEWFYRVAQEPRRLWKRYLVTNAKFGALLLRTMVASWFVDEELAGYPDE
jgi:N-acetylglucosaminyldiphosphoundecaprenol N-acetyl-beta-D-mannosaminyltransferase